jgi:Tol biopolymer transport system component
MFYSPTLSHDEKRIAVDVSDLHTANGDIWIFDLVRGTSTRLTYDPANESAPIWSSDDRRIFYFSERLGDLQLFARDSSGTGSEELLLADDKTKIPQAVSPDGRLLAYTGETKKHIDVFLLDLATRKPAPLLVSPFNEEAPYFSSDGKWICYASDESGQTEVYAQKFPASTGKFIVSRGGGSAPAFSADGHQIYYVSLDGKMMSVPVSLAASFDAGAPVALFEARLRSVARRFDIRQYSVTRDGSKFLLNRLVGEEGTRPITLVQNWSSQLEHR